MSKTELGLWEIGVPDPSDLSRPWRDVASFGSREEAVTFVREFMGGDAQGRISLISKSPGGDGWSVDLPNPDDPAGPWITFDVWPTKAAAAKYLGDTVSADPDGRISVLFRPPDEEGGQMSGADDDAAPSTRTASAKPLEALRRGDIFLWAKPYPDEDPMQQYVLLDDPGEHGGALDIQALGTGMAFPPVNRVARRDPVIYLTHAPTPEELEPPKTKKAGKK